MNNEIKFHQLPLKKLQMCLLIKQFEYTTESDLLCMIDQFIEAQLLVRHIKQALHAPALTCYRVTIEIKHLHC